METCYLPPCHQYAEAELSRCKNRCFTRTPHTDIVSKLEINAPLYGISVAQKQREDQNALSLIKNCANFV
ncbi:hypothetical protein KCP78_18635 [Salmonella enterica subsp. enterica]|nr:hypothetical protein KCP78_18635 [Salmonella enterica subsp. enterica]